MKYSCRLATLHQCPPPVPSPRHAHHRDGGSRRVPWQPRRQAAGGRGRRRPVVLVTIDTLRADRLGSYGSARGLTPALDRFAQTATRFSAAVTQVPLTVAAHATILTGLHPAHHGVRTNDGAQPRASVTML